MGRQPIIVWEYDNDKDIAGFLYSWVHLKATEPKVRSTGKLECFLIDSANCIARVRTSRRFDAVPHSRYTTPKIPNLEPALETTVPPFVIPCPEKAPGL